MVSLFFQLCAEAAGGMALRGGSGGRNRATGRRLRG